MDVEREAIKISNGLSIPTSRLEFNEYRDHERDADVTQVYFRDKYPPKNKYAFEIVLADGSGVPSDIAKNSLRNQMARMEEAYLEGSGRVTFYRGQAFFWRVLFDNSQQDYRPTPNGISDTEKYLEIECASCGWQLETMPIDAGTFNKYRDVLLVWLLGRGAGRCGCGEFEPIEKRDTADTKDVCVEEGDKLPRVI